MLNSTNVSSISKAYGAQRKARFLAVCVHVRLVMTNRWPTLATTSLNIQIISFHCDKYIKCSSTVSHTGDAHPVIKVGLRRTASLQYTRACYMPIHLFMALYMFSSYKYVFCDDLSNFTPDIHKLSRGSKALNVRFSNHSHMLECVCSMLPQWPHACETKTQFNFAKDVKSIEKAKYNQSIDVLWLFGKQNQIIVDSSQL